MWKNIVERDRVQMTVWRTRIACCIPKATDTHSEYVILIAFPTRQWLHVHCLSCYHLATIKLPVWQIFVFICSDKKTAAHSADRPYGLRELTTALCEIKCGIWSIKRVSQKNVWNWGAEVQEKRFSWRSMSLFCAFPQYFRKATVSFFMFVRLSAWNNSAPTVQIFMKIDIWGFFGNLQSNSAQPILYMKTNIHLC